MTNAEIDNQLKQLETDYLSDLEAYLTADTISSGPNVIQLVKQLTDEYYNQKLILKALRTGGATA